MKMKKGGYDWALEKNKNTSRNAVNREVKQLLSFQSLINKQQNLLKNFNEMDVKGLKRNNAEKNLEQLRKDYFGKLETIIEEDKYGYFKKKNSDYINVLYGRSDESVEKDGFYVLVKKIFNKNMGNPKIGKITRNSEYLSKRKDFVQSIIQNNNLIQLMRIYGNVFFELFVIYFAENYEEYKNFIGDLIGNEEFKKNVDSNPEIDKFKINFFNYLLDKAVREYFGKDAIVRYIDFLPKVGTVKINQEFEITTEKPEHLKILSQDNSTKFMYNSKDNMVELVYKDNKYTFDIKEANDKFTIYKTNNFNSYVDKDSLVHHAYFKIWENGKAFHVDLCAKERGKDRCMKSGIATTSILSRKEKLSDEKALNDFFKSLIRENLRGNKGDDLDFSNQDFFKIGKIEEGKIKNMEGNYNYFAYCIFKKEYLKTKVRIPYILKLHKDFFHFLRRKSSTGTLTKNNSKVSMENLERNPNLENVSITNL